MSDKATVELVAKAICAAYHGNPSCEECEHCQPTGHPDTKVLWQRWISEAKAVLAALPTPTDASGLVELIDQIGEDIITEYEPFKDSSPMVNSIVTQYRTKIIQALAQHREGKQWSDDRPQEASGVLSDTTLLWRDDKGNLWVECDDQWYGPLHPPADKEG